MSADLTLNDLLAVEDLSSLTPRQHAWRVHLRQRPGLPAAPYAQGRWPSWRTNDGYAGREPDVEPEQHTITYRRYQKGKTAIRPTRPVYGTTGHCSCGWEGRSNSAPSGGGRSDLRIAHEHETGRKARVL